MTGEELIESLKHDGDVSRRVMIQLPDGRMVDIKCVDTGVKRDPYDGDFDEYVTIIEVEA